MSAASNIYPILQLKNLFKCLILELNELSSPCELTTMIVIKNSMQRENNKISKDKLNSI